ncbi:unnamed protein product [Closterium sp. NIES-64]|nr:unnamed protein product [Closterium sp. NIES-64]
MGVEVTHGGERSRKKKAATGHPGSTAAGRQARLDVVEHLRAENRRLRADNARLERRLGEQTGRVDSLASALAGVLDKLKALTAQVADTDRNLAKRLEDATSTMATTITDNLTDNMASAVEAAKSFAELAAKILRDLDDPNGRMAVERATEVNALAEHVTNEVGEARKFLEETVIKYIGAVQTNIADAIAPRLVVQQPPPPIAPAQALPDELMKSFKEDVLKAVTEATQQSFLASGLEIMTEVVGTVAPARRGSSPSANDAGQPHPKEAQKHGQKRGGGEGGGDGEDATSVKRSKRLVGPAWSVKAARELVGPSWPAKAARELVGPASSANAARELGTLELETVRQSNLRPCVPRVALAVAARTPADPKSALLRKQLGTRGSTAPTQQEAGSSAMPTSGNVAAPTPVAADIEKAAEKGVHAALATGSSPVEEVAPDVDIAAIQAQLDAAKPRTLAVSDTAHAEQPASPAGGSADCKTADDAVGEEKAKRKGKAGSQRKTREKSEVKATGKRKEKAEETAADVMSVEKGKAGENQEKSVGEGTSTGRKGKEKAVGEGTSTGRKGKEKAAEKRKEKEEEEDEEEEEEEEDEEEQPEEEEWKDKAKEKERRGHGIRHDNSGDGQGWVGEIKVHGINRYIGKSREKMELAYVHSIAFVVYDGFVSKVLMDELTGLDTAELERWRKVWEEVKILPTGMWTVMWVRGVLLPKTQLNDILDKYHECKRSGDVLHDALWPAMWFLVEGVPEEKSAMIGCCFVKNDDAKVADAVEEGKAAALIAGASYETAKVFENVMVAVLNAEITRDRPLGEVAFSVAPALQSLGLQRVYPRGNAGVDAEVVARATVETMAFWGMCLVAGPKHKKRSIAVPCDAQMKADLDNRGRKGQRGKQGTKGKKGKDGTGKKGRKGKDSTAA